MTNKLTRSEAGKLGRLKSDAKLKEYYAKFKEEYYKNPKKCRFCDKILEYKDRRNDFCSRSCSASLGNIGVNRHLKDAMEEHGLDVKKPKDIQHYLNHIRVPNYCLCCGKETDNKYCSNQCQNDYKWSITKQNIVKIGSVNLNAIANSKAAKRYLKETRGIKCEICSITEWMTKEVPLVLDHINGNPSDWSLENLRLICGNCDMQTSTYKGKNRGHGRFSRKMRYRTGKSY